MSSLYTKTNGAYNTISNMDPEVAAYILNNEVNGVDYSDMYENATALLGEASSLLAVLYDRSRHRNLLEPNTLSAS